MIYQPKDKIRTFQGEPCPHGHTLRYKIGNKCVECLRSRNAKNRVLRSDYMKVWRQEPENKARVKQYMKEYKLFYSYGLPYSEYNSLVAAQDSRCAICDAVSENLYVDHNHETGAIRELLCNDCNIVLGIFKDDPIRFKNAVNYLEKHNGNQK